jgi:hypothetical protein
MLGDEARPASKSAARAPVAVLALYVLTTHPIMADRSPPVR